MEEKDIINEPTNSEELEGIQTSFNTDSIEELMDETTIVENVVENNEEEEI